MTPLPDMAGLLLLPHLKIQNANTISSQMTWGFPPMSAFMGLMYALERKIGRSNNLQFNAVGVICHSHTTQTSGKYRHQFHLTRNPVGKDGASPSIVEEGRMHLDITLVFGIDGSILQESEEEKTRVAASCYHMVSSMRIAGGSVIPSDIVSKNHKPELIELGEDKKCEDIFCKLRYKFMPGFALVSRDDLLHNHLKELQKSQSSATLLDSLLDQSRFNYESVRHHETGQAIWRNSRGKGSGWIVPIPVGYQALSPLYPVGTVMNARDDRTQFRFVENVYSLGEWVSPHRLRNPKSILWYRLYDDSDGLYKVCNDYKS